MKKIKQVNIKNGTYYFFNDMITLESQIIVPTPPAPLGHLYSNPPIINVQSFLLTLWSVNSHLHHSPS